MSNSGRFFGSAVPSPWLYIKDIYAREYVGKKHPDYAARWPLLSGFTVGHAMYKGVSIFVFKAAPGSSPNLEQYGELPASLIGADRIDKETKQGVRRRL